MRVVLAREIANILQPKPAKAEPTLSRPTGTKTSPKPQAHWHSNPKPQAPVAAHARGSVLAQKWCKSVQCSRVRLNVELKKIQ